MSFWDIFELIASAFFFLAYLLVLFQIIGDLFRDQALGGLAKALWIIGLLFVPILTALLYLVVRGRGMGERQREAALQARASTEDYIRQVARRSPVDQISDATRLLDAGKITLDEYSRLKARALA